MSGRGELYFLDGSQALPFLLLRLQLPLPLKYLGGITKSPPPLARGLPSEVRLARRASSAAELQLPLAKGAVARPEMGDPV